MNSNSNSKEMKEIQAKLKKAGHPTSIRFITNNGIRDWWMLTQVNGIGLAQFRAVGVENIKSEAANLLKSV